MPVTGNVNGLAIMHDRRLVDVDELAADAARWRYLRDHHAQGHSPKMDGTLQWRFIPLYGAAGRSPDEAVDQLIKLAATAEETSKSNDHAASNELQSL